jgi:hypothetical protein
VLKRLEYEPAAVTARVLVALVLGRDPSPGYVSDDLRLRLQSGASRKAAATIHCTHTATLDHTSKCING